MQATWSDLVIKSAQNKPVAELLSSDASWRFRVPRYQREYVWRRENWANLFDDILENPDGYFLGSMICINRSDDTMKVQELEVVDGQQRLTTLSLLYAAIYWALGQCVDGDDEARMDLQFLKHRLVLKGRPPVVRMEPSRQGGNYDDYMAILGDSGVLRDVETPPNAGNRRLFKAYRFFIDRLDELDDKGKRVFDSARINEFMQQLNRACLVKIEVASHADAFTLFESLNNRGVPLSALDLIKNNLLAQLERVDPNSVDENFERWRRMLECLSGDYSAQERFLRHYYNAFKHRQEISVAKVSLATKSNIIHVYDTLIHRDAAGLFDDLAEKAKHFGRMIQPLGEGTDAALAKQLLDLDRIGGAPAYMLLLYLFAERPKADLTGITALLVRYFARRNVTDVPPTRDLARLFISVIDLVRESRDADSLRVVREGLLKGKVATDEVFKSKLEGALYLDNPDATRFILCRIEEERQTKESSRNLWERDSNGDFVWTVEHIFPQGENIPKKWVEMIANGDRVRASELRERHVHKLGNLTLTGYNSKLGTKSFEEKRDRADQQGRLVGYRNGIWLNASLAKAADWTVDGIESRTALLVSLALKLFAL